MILLLGKSGFIGSAFVNELASRGLDHYCPIRAVYCNPHSIGGLLRSKKPTLVINAAAFIPPESVSLCDQNQAETIRGNVLLPQMLAQSCYDAGIPFAHISTGCLWSDGLEHSEDDPPQRAFTGHCGFYVGTKVLSEEAVRKSAEKHYIWRVRLPFDEVDHPRNYLSKLARFDTIWDHQNTLCHRGDFVKACLDLWQMQADWGTYSVVNTGSIKAAEIIDMLIARGIRKTPATISDKADGGCLLSNTKMVSAGVKIRSCREAVFRSIAEWKEMPK